MFVFRREYLNYFTEDALELLSDSGNIWIQIREGAFELIAISDNIWIFQKKSLAYAAPTVF